MINIRDFFQPSQPSVAYEQYHQVSYNEVSPTKELQGHIYCYWQLRTTEKLDSPYVYRVVSDGCIDILAEKTLFKDIYITGFSTNFIEYPLGNSFNYLGIRFLPCGFPMMFNTSAGKFTNNFLKLDETMPQLSKELSQSVDKSESLDEFSGLLNPIFLRILEQSKETIKPDMRVLNAINTILRSGGKLDLKALDTGISPRQLRRLFQFYFGDTPKTFGKVIRFQNVLKSKPSVSSLKKNKVFYDVGYYDQSHFIKEFKQFYGVTPSRAFGR